MNNDDVTTLQEAIEKWRLPGKKVIIGIDGYSGAGKTSLINSLKNEDVLIVNRDDFAIPRIDFDARFRATKSEEDKVSLLVNENINTTELVAFLKKYKSRDGIVEWTLRDDITGLKDVVKKFDFSKEVLVIEGILLYKHDSLNCLFDRRIYLDIDIEKADERRRIREKNKWGENYFPDTHPDSYFRLIKIGLDKYLDDEKPADWADLVLRSY